MSPNPRLRSAWHWKACCWTKRSAKLHGCMDRLSETQRDAIRTAFFEGITYAELADVRGVPTSTMKSRIGVASNGSRSVSTMTSDETDLTAAELALGVLDGDERTAAMRRVLDDPAFASNVAGGGGIWLPCISRSSRSRRARSGTPDPGVRRQRQSPYGTLASDCRFGRSGGRDPADGRGNPSRYASRCTACRQACSLALCRPHPRACRADHGVLRSCQPHVEAA